MQTRCITDSLVSTRLSCWLATCVATAIIGVVAYSGNSAPLALNGQLVIRPLTPQEKKDYGLTNYQGASGLSAVGIGQPVYLDALANIGIAPSSITNVVWTLTSQPAGSTATLQTSPLGTNVPPYRMRDRLDLQVVGRKMLVPDVAGQYEVSLSIQSATNGTTNVTQKLTAGTYMGRNVCALCHSGGTIAQNIFATYTNTPHATFFTRAINGQEASYYNKNCISCHTVGYDTAPAAVNGGFDDVATQLGWTFPTNIADTNLAAGNWDAMPAALKNLANIQCENCHGPGSEHAMSLGNTNLSNWPRIGITYSAGNCSQCHDSLPHHYRSAEWSNSGHAIATRTPSGAGRQHCVRCHTAAGFAGYISHAPGVAYSTNLTYEAITCQACHDPHADENPHQLRAGYQVTLGDGTVVTNAGSGGFCMNCHQVREGSVTNMLAKYPLNQPTWAGGVGFSAHDSSQADMLMGVNAVTYGLDIPSSAHRYAVSNTCVGCHMQEVAENDPAFTKAGGHSTKMSYSVVTNGVTNTVDLVKVCQQCHGPVESFDLVRADYNGDGVMEGVQTEVQRLLDKLSTLLPNSTYRADGNYVADGKVKVIDRNTVKTNWPVKFLKAAYNYMFVNADGSKGIHNAPFAVGILKASIADLTDDWNNDGLPDTWQIANFGSLTNTNAAPNAAPAGDGIPNWLKYSLGINPMVPGIVVPDGVVWVGASGTTLINPPGTNAVLKIYTAAEIAFDTEVGKTYQIQAVSSLGGGWQNVGTPIQGTGSPVSYVTRVRSGVKQFYRVVVTP